MDKIHQKINATHIAPEWESKPSETCSLAPRRESGFAYGRNEVSPDSEQIEHVIAEQFMRNSVSVEQIQDRVRESKPSGGTNVVRGEQESAETSSFRCDCERCHLSRGADKPSRGQELYPRPFVGEGVRRTGEGSHPDKIAQQVRNDSVSSLAPGGRGVGRGGKVAFTLAEVLITLGIIGVVAAMTLPSLIQNYQKKALATQTQKFYSMMSQAVKQYIADYGVDDLRNTPLASDNYERSYSPEAIASLRDFVTKYLKVVKECNPNDEDDNNCFAPVYRLWDNSFPDEDNFSNMTDSRFRDYVLADGSVISTGYHVSEAPITLYVDVNGKRGPNRIGYDLWSMSIFYDGVIDESGVTPECRKEGIKCNLAVGDVNTPAEAREGRFDSCKRDNPYGGCFGHLLENGFKFDY